MRRIASRDRARKERSGHAHAPQAPHMRWDYAIPPGKHFLCDGHDFHLYTADSHPRREDEAEGNEVMRAPHAFLPGKLDFAKEFRDFEVKPEGNGWVGSGRAKRTSCRTKVSICW